MAASGSGGYGGPNFSQINNDLRAIAIQFGSIVSLTQQLRASIDTFRMFERELTLANFAAGGTAETFNQMEKAARNMALGSTNSVAQLANAFGNLARAGLDASEVLSAATGVMLLANATLSDLGEAADITASTMAQFNLRADESGRIANLFVAASNNSLASMNKLAFAMRQVGPIAAQANISLEQTVGMLDKLFDAGLRGEQAGTALRNVIARLVDPMGEGKAVLENLGVSAINEKGQTDIDAALRKLSTMRLSLQDVSNIFGVEAASGALTLLESIRNLNGGLDEHIAKISGTNDAYGQAMAQMATLDGSLSQAGNAFNELRLIAGESMAPALITLSQSFVDLVLWLRELDTGVITATGQLLLMGVGVGVIVKGVSMIAPAMAATTKAMTAFTMAGRAATLMNAAFSQSMPVTGLRAMSLGAAQAGKGLLGLTAAAGGLLGIATAIGAITFSLIEMEKAKRAAKIDEILGETGLNSDQARRDLRNTGLQYNVDERTGAGAIEKYNALDERRRGAEEELKKADAAIKDLEQNQISRFAELSRQVDNLSDFSNFINERLVAESYGGAQDVTIAAQALGNATGSQWPAAVKAFEQAYIRSVQTSDKPEAVKERLIAQARSQFEVILQADGDIKADIQAKIKQISATGETIEVETGTFGQRIASTIARAFDLTKSEYVLGRGQVDARRQELLNEQAGFRATIDAAAAEQAALVPVMRTQIENFVRITYGSATDAGNATAEAIDRWIEKNPERFAEIIRQAGNDTVRAIQLIEKESQIQVTRIQEALDAMGTGSIPTLPKEKIDEYWYKAMRASVEAAGDAATTSMREAARDARQVAGANEWRSEAVEMIAGAISDNDAQTTARAVVAGIESGTIRNLGDVEAAVTQAGGILTPETREAAGRVVTAAITLRDANVREAQNAFAPRNTGNRRGGMSVSQRAIDKILDLPTEAEFALEGDILVSQIRNRMAEYFGFQADAYRLGMQQAELDYRETQLDLQRDFEKFWRDNIAKGLDIAISEEAINAISGRGFTLNGREFTSEMLKTSEGATEYITNAMLFLSPMIPANAPEAEKRIEALNRVLMRLGEQSVGQYNMLQQEFRALEVAKRQTEEAARQAAQGFDFEQAAQLLQGQLDLVTLTDPLNMNMRAVISFDLELANIRTEGNAQIDALQEEYMAQFKALGVFAEISGDQINISADQAGALTEAQLKGADDLIARYNVMLGLIQQLTDAKIADALAGVNGVEAQRQAWEDYIEAAEKAANANGNVRDVMDDFISGVGAGYARLLADLPTSFEVGMDVMTTAVNGFVDTTSSAILGMGDDWREGVSSILKSIAMMITKMLVMAATLQMIRMIPGGTALLAAMDASAPVVNAASNAAGAVSAARGGVTANAYGGVHDHEQMFNGGVKRPGDTSLAIFGEGMWPEAFVPMVDGATIPVQMGVDGRYYVPLPSGQKIAVSMKKPVKKFAYGGVSGNVITNPQQLMAANYAASQGSDTLAYGGSVSRGGDNVTYQISSTVIIQGNATAEDADKISQAQADAVGGLLVAHEAEQNRKRLRRESRRGYDPRGTI